MSEVTFAKSYLATLDKRPIKIAADYASDPRKYPNQSPYILPRQANPFPRNAKSSSPPDAQATQTISITLKPMRGGETVTLSGVALDSTIYDLKTQYAAKSGSQQDKIKLLLNKKPAADLKTLKDLGVEADAELSVMIMGGATATSPAATSVVEEKASPAAAAVPSPQTVDPAASAPNSERAQAEAGETKAPLGPATAAEFLKTDEFWSDLQAFLSQRLRDEDEAKVLAGVFKEAWKKT